MEGQIDLDALERAAMAATPGHWADDGWEHVGACSGDQANNGYFVAECCGPDRKKNMAYIAAANPAVILGLVARVRAADESHSKLLTAAQEAAEQIRRCDYTLARYTLLRAFTDASMEASHA